MMKDPFLDMCSVVEESELDILEKRALVTKNTNIQTLEQGFKKIGCENVKGMMFRATGASQIEEFCIS